MCVYVSSFCDWGNGAAPRLTDVMERRSWLWDGHTFVNSQTSQLWTQATSAYHNKPRLHCLRVNESGSPLIAKWNKHTLTQLDVRLFFQQVPCGPVSILWATNVSRFNLPTNKQVSGVAYIFEILYCSFTAVLWNGSNCNNHILFSPLKLDLWSLSVKWNYILEKYFQIL